MLADSSFGNQGDVAEMTFTVPTLKLFRAIMFDIFVGNLQGGSVQVCH